MSEGTKFDNGKKRWDLLPFGSIDAVASVLTFGAGKYGDRNWEDNALTPQRIEAALGRHYSAHMQGEYDDQESGLPHLAHVACCALMALAKYERFGFAKSGEVEVASITFDSREAARKALEKLNESLGGQESFKVPELIKVPIHGGDEDIPKPSRGSIYRVVEEQAKQERRGRPKKWVCAREAADILGTDKKQVYAIARSCGIDRRKLRVSDRSTTDSQRRYRVEFSKPDLLALVKRRDARNG